MKIPDHIENIKKEIKAMRKDRHDRHGRVGILMDSIDYNADAILEASHDIAKPFYPPD